MTKSRDTLISVESTPYYHCISRCVRRAFLCGEDRVSGNSYEHRRAWVEDKLLELPNIFAIDVAAYAVMSNHYHAVLHIDVERAKSWSDRDVVENWHRLFNGTVLSQKFLKEASLKDYELMALQPVIDEWRDRLQSISWFMRVLNEAIARQANQEDGCSGRFWEGRFKSQALLDEAALLACMAYVDLNPVRAKMAITPEKSHHTSIKKRCAAAKKSQQPNRISQQEKTLLPFVGNPKNDNPKYGIQMRLSDYLILLDNTGRIIRQDKRGYIDDNAKSVLKRLGVEEDKWLEMTTGFEGCFKNFVGHESSLRKASEILHYQRAPGLAACRSMFH